MSQSGRGERKWRFYLDDMLGFARKVLTYTDGIARRFIGTDYNDREHLRQRLLLPWRQRLIQSAEDHISTPRSMKCPRHTGIARPRLPSESEVRRDRR